MKNWSVLVLGLAISARSFCQDSVSMSYSEEQDTLKPIRFIDRYENIFMNKVPTKNIFKLGISQYQQSIPYALYNDKGFKNSAVQISYEHKLSQEYSVALYGQMPLVGNAIPASWILKNTAVGAQFRWYYDMRRRISSGRSANNFTGNYLALELSNTFAMSKASIVQIRTGFQRRFLNFGFLDLSIGLRQNFPFAEAKSLSNWNIFSEISFGIALGDWKRAAIPSMCELVRCEQHVSRQIKVQIPDVKFGKSQKLLGGSVAYELALGKSPISLNFQYDLSLQRADNYLQGYFDTPSHSGWYAGITESEERSQTFSMQPRFYVNQRKRLQLGKVGNGLSGIYVGMNLEMAAYKGTHVVFNPWLHTPEHTVKATWQAYRVGALMGLQRRLFEKGYIDFNLSYNSEKNRNVGQMIPRLRANLTVGFLFVTQ